MAVVWLSAASSPLVHSGPRGNWDLACSFALSGTPFFIGIELRYMKLFTCPSITGSSTTKRIQRSRVLRDTGNAPHYHVHNRTAVPCASVLLYAVLSYAMLCYAVLCCAALR